MVIAIFNVRGIVRLLNVVRREVAMHGRARVMVVPFVDVLRRECRSRGDVRRQERQERVSEHSPHVAIMVWGLPDGQRRVCIYVRHAY
jgi:hypothetical protein